MKKVALALLTATAVLMLSSCQAKKCECKSVVKIGETVIKHGPTTIEIKEGQKCKDLEGNTNAGGLQGEVTCRSIY